jgi:penicillin-binding protein 1A
VQAGTGTSAQIGCPAAGKTGTTDQHSDAWFVGYTPRLSTAVWVGYPDAQVHMLTEYHGASVAGGTYPAEIWGDYMGQARGKYCGGFPSPKHPASFSRFYGKYASGSVNTGPGSSGTSYYTPQAPVTGTTVAPVPTAAPPPTDTPAPDPAPAGEDDAAPDTGGQGFDPAQYESPPQEPDG